MLGHCLPVSRAPLRLPNSSSLQGDVLALALCLAVPVEHATGCIPGLSQSQASKASDPSPSACLQWAVNHSWRRRGGEGNGDFWTDPATNQGWPGHLTAFSILRQPRELTGPAGRCVRVSWTCWPQPAYVPASPTPTKSWTCVLFIPKLTYATYRNLCSFDWFWLGFFEHLYLATDCIIGSAVETGDWLCGTISEIQ